MQSKELLIRRISIIKLLYKLGIDQSYKNEAVSGFSVLMFHDSIEMFLKLAAEHYDINSNKFDFIEYWEKLPSLTLKESMRALNARRVSIKHKGLLPSKQDIEISRVHATDFFEQNTKPIFDLDFSEVSLFELIKFPETKKLLIEANNFLAKNDIIHCVENTTISFYELLREYKENKKYFGGYRTHFEFIEPISFDRDGTAQAEAPETAREIEKAVDKMNDNLEQMERALGMISLGIDYPKYSKFMILTPVCTKIMDGPYVCEIVGEKIWSAANCQFLLDFVLECALKLQDFDYDNEDLIGTDSFVLELL